MTTSRFRLAVFAAISALAGLSMLMAQNAERGWLAGDSHVHSHWSPGYDRTKSPPEPLKGQDAVYSTPQNAQKAAEYGLSWMVTTDHGGPNHSKLNLVHAYAELKESRRLVPNVLQFYGMELNMPAMDHHTLIMPKSDDEWKTLFNIESQFDANEAWPPEPSRDTEAAAFQALTFMKGIRRLPLMFANHPSRSATGVGIYGLDEPAEFRNHNDLAPDLYKGMEGAPGHQASALAQDGSLKRDGEGRPAGNRGAYANANARTLGGFDQMTAILGGLWDAMLGEGRRFWIVATSDSHANFADPVNRGSDFWPGQYQKTYVHASRTYDDVLDGLRRGRVFAVAGDLVSELDLRATSGRASAAMGGTLTVRRGANITVTVRFRDPSTPNAHGDNPGVARVDLIVGQVNGPARDRRSDRNGSTRVVARFRPEAWTASGEVREVALPLPAVQSGMYIRVRGTSTSDLEPPMDSAGENPWADLWFYSNPVFIEVR
jgi:hypothetical protein